MSGYWRLFGFLSCVHTESVSIPTTNVPNLSSGTAVIDSQSEASPKRVPRNHSPDVVRFLEKYTKDQRHFQKSFLKHLRNVHDLLYYKFNEAEYLCDAGLFHSIYGTEFFQFSSKNLEGKDPITREKIQSLIGQRSEEIVYLFCSLKTRRLDSILENSMTMSPMIQLDLCKLEYANLLDQNYNLIYANSLERLRKKIQSLRQELSVAESSSPPLLAGIDEDDNGFQSASYWMF